MQRSPELEAIFRRVLDSAFADDVAAARNLISMSDQSRLILTGDDEWFSGHAEIAGLFVLRTQEADLLTHDFEIVEGYEQGTVGWVAGLVSSKRRDGGEPLRLRHSVVFVLEAGAWRIVHWHVSRGTPNIEVFGHEMPKSIDGMVETLDDTRQTVAASFPTGTVTVMFTDVVDSTVLTSEMGDDEWTSAIADHFSVVRNIVERRGGVVVKSLGDGAMTAFGSAGAAVDAAVDLQTAMNSSPLDVRIGMHTGDSLRHEGDYYGTAVNKAARVAAIAEGGEIIVSSVTAELSGGHGITFGPPRTVDLKGLDGTHVILPVAWQA